MTIYAQNRRRFVGAAGLSLAAAWVATQGSVVQWMTASPFASSSGTDLTALGRATGWINAAPLAPADLRGKVVLIDFWTYTCINWLRTAPYVRAWAARYHRHGLVVIGVHTPEFSFEENIDNVRRSAKERGITYPIAIDNDRAIWRGFDNHYWPALYFVDAAGRVRDHHFGEGRYEESETRIRELLSAAGTGTGLPGGYVSPEAHGPEAAPDWGSLKSPETYVGYQRAEGFASPGGAATNRRRVYAVPPRLRLNQWALSGEWTMNPEAAVLNTAGGRIAHRFHARDLHLIMGPTRGRPPLSFRVLIDGHPPGTNHGSDVDGEGNGTLVHQGLYQLIRQSGPITERQFEIEFLAPGVEAFAFAFG